MRIPAPLQDTERTLGLRQWVRRRGFPLADYCQTVDGGREIVRRHQPPDDEEGAADDQVVPVIAAALDAEGALLAHCLENAYEIPDDEAWAKVLRAAAWVVLQRYQLAVRNGEWTPS